MRELVEAVAKRLVDNPDAVIVRETVGEKTCIIELTVAPEDLGKVIGKQGRIANAMRTLFGAIGMRERKRYSLEILE